MPLILLPRRNRCKPYITIPSGCYGLVQRHGADYAYPGTGQAVWPPGFHWASPFTQVSHLVTKQVRGGGGKESVRRRVASAPLSLGICPGLGWVPSRPLPSRVAPALSPLLARQFVIFDTAAKVREMRAAASDKGGERAP